jgi:putative oxidoreductase
LDLPRRCVKLLVAMFDRLSRYAPHILGITRILFGVMMAAHGAQKLFGLFGGLPPGVPPLVVLGAGPLEFVGGLLLAIGLFPRWTAFILSGEMAAAYFIGHAMRSFWPSTNGGELAVIYCWLALYLAAQGPGKFALANRWPRTKT